MIDWTICGSI